VKRRPILFLCFLLLLAPGPGRSQSHPPFALEARREGVLLGAGAALGLTSLILGAQVEPLTPHEIAGLDLNDVNQFDRSGFAAYRDDLAGDGLLAVSYALPLTLLAKADCRRDWHTLTMMWAETTLLNVGTAGVVKSSVQRTRPFAYDPRAPIDIKTSKTGRFSFYSGHTSQAAANCFFTARVFSMYATHNGTKILVWAGAALYPAVTGYLRVDSGHHFRTDVMAGYCMGALFGFLVPELHRLRGLRFIQPVAFDDASGLGLRFSFQ